MPKGLVEPGADEQFCCTGCRGAYAVIQGSGLVDYYRYRDAAGTDSPPQAPEYTGGGFTSFDTEAFPEAARPADDQRALRCGPAGWKACTARHVSG